MTFCARPNVVASSIALPAATSATDLDNTPFPYDSTASFSLNSDGSFSYVGNVSGTAGAWTVSQDNTANYEVQATMISGTFSTGTVGSWLRLNSNRTWSCTYFSSATPGFKEASATLEIRDLNTLVVVATSTLTIRAEGSNL